MVQITGDAMTIAGLNAGKYIASVRNIAKQEYARRYLLYILQGRQGPHPRSDSPSTINSQAVRLRLDRIFRETSL
jgi:hypothetical protein